MCSQTLSYAQQPGVRPPKDNKKTKGVVAQVGSEEEMVYLNVQDQDIRDVIIQISKATSKNFIIDDKVRGKVTIISERPMSKEEAYQAFLSALEVAGYTVVTGPGGIIKIVSLKNAARSPIPIHVDTTPYTDSFVTRLISLQNISANEMATAIKNLISPAGNLFAYPKTNTLIITDSGTNIDRLMKLIKELDQEGPQEVLEIIPIKHANAKEIAQTILDLFKSEKKTTRTTRTRRGSTPALEDMAEVSKIIADDRTNSIIVLASKRAIGKVRSIIAKMDSPIGREGKIHVYHLNHANAETLAQTLSALTSGSGNKVASKGKKGASGVSSAQLEGGINIVADETINALIITASPKDYRTLVKELIEKLDIPRRQVYLESIIMELRIEKEGEYGIKGYGGKYLGAFLPFASSFGAADPSNFANVFSSGGLLGGVISRDTINIDVPVAGGGTQTTTMPAFAAFLNLIQVYSDTNIVSTPNILTLDNEEAEISIVRKIWIPQTTNTATGLSTQSYEPQDVGLTLTITPQISKGRSVRLVINSKLENLDGAVPTTVNQPPPPTTKREIKTTVVAMDGQTVVLGGLMEDQISQTKHKVPLLGDIPILGFLFSSTKNTKKKNNLLVFITPYVIDDPSDFALITKRKIEERNRFISSNYGKRKQRAIKKMIAIHREDLLEYAPPIPTTPYPGTQNNQTPPGAQTPQTYQTPATTTYPTATQTGVPQDIDLGY